MCGRYRLSRRKQMIHEYFDTATGSYTLRPAFATARHVPFAAVCRLNGMGAISWQTGC